MISREEAIIRTARDLREACASGASRMLTFGSDLIPNGLAPTVISLVEDGVFTHLASTFSSIVDDWTVARGTAQDAFLHVNLAILCGARAGLGIGESVAEAMRAGCIELPPECVLRAEMLDVSESGRAAASARLLGKMAELGLPSGKIEIEFPRLDKSIAFACCKAGIPYTIHPQFGLDDIFADPSCSFGAVGQAAEADFLQFVQSVYGLEGGVYLSVGSSVASPMIFEKALSMSQNVRRRSGSEMTAHKIVVVDLAESGWDWMGSGEPPEDRPEYYLRYCKSFSRAAARTMYYICADNRDFFHYLCDALR